MLEIARDAEPFELNALLLRVAELLTPAVVENLPPYFQGIESLADAERWLELMLSESRLFAVQDKDNGSILGFLFIYIEDAHDAHIGYLLGEAYWGQGLASELIRGLIALAIEAQEWSKLIGGVDKTNQASSNLLRKLGFVELPAAEPSATEPSAIEPSAIEPSAIDDQVAFYEYHLSRP
ncbi:GNAT family N-acetyltransferase [Shewanella sp. AS16]|uniref:GNAT family N-acetyltransferase n=1 Tax=Shewanella sp. AS16 TaxID=2907625 RepID=UPI001F407085|nr:GNAT family N-acetyltransferase [Shewanella sp. AS16]MCE9684892.1 GNAT family N-acetyltransferase [Shewanella sp. AS16]